ncbi:MAG: hypothetical protein H0T65_01640 [Deltaproteobacteria bacterium]|nr:hypothetical protein [Deltaproteobacteria bacterium]
MRRLAHFASGTAALIALARVASAQAPAPEPAAGPLATVKDDKQLNEALAVITNDPSVPTDDPSVRPLAQALMIEGVKQLQSKSYEQALANFLEAYAKFPSPKILLNIASTLRDMGRLADAANTYQRYLLDPATGAERVAEVKELLLRLDEQLTILTVRVFPRGSSLSIDGGPFIPVGTTLQTRVRPGIHLVRIRQSEAGNEITVNGFEGENKDVAATVQMDVAPPTPTPTPTPAPTPTPTPTPTVAPKVEPPEQVQAWLSTGTQYSSDGTGRSRRPRSGFGGVEISPITPAFDIGEDNTAIIREPDRFGISSGVLAVVRVDGEGRGIAGGIGLAVSLGRWEGDLMYLRSNLHGGYVGARYRLFVGWLRPYLALGMPVFIYDEMTDTGTSKRVALGVRGAGGVELKINGHLSVHADVGYERFFAVEETLFYTNYFIPTVGVIGRL